MPNDESEIYSATVDSEEQLIGCILEYSRLYRTDKAIREVERIIKATDFLGVTPTDKPERWTPRARIFHAMTLCERYPTDTVVSAKMADLGMLLTSDIIHMKHCEYTVGCTLDYGIFAKDIADYSKKRQAKYYADKGDLKSLNRITNNPLGTVPL